MINLFKKDPKGDWSTKDGSKYTVVTVNESKQADYPSKDGWRESLSDALSVPAKRTAKPKEEQTRDAFEKVSEGDD